MAGEANQSVDTYKNCDRPVRKFLLDQVFTSRKRPAETYKRMMLSSDKSSRPGQTSIPDRLIWSANFMTLFRKTN